MAYRIEGIRNFAIDQGYQDFGEIMARAQAASVEFGQEGLISAEKVEEVLGDATRALTYARLREIHLVRYY